MVVNVQPGQPLRRDASPASLAHVALVIMAIAGVSNIAHFGLRYTLRPKRRGLRRRGPIT